jgi:hypothetical protein
MPLTSALREEGWDDERIAALEKAKQAEAASAQTSLASALAAQQRAFDAGQGQPVPAVMSGNGRTT